MSGRKCAARMKFILVDTVDEVLAAALSEPGEYPADTNGPASKLAVKTSKPVVKKERKKNASAQS